MFSTSRTWPREGRFIAYVLSSRLIYHFPCDRYAQGGGKLMMTITRGLLATLVYTSGDILRGATIAIDVGGFSIAFGFSYSFFICISWILRAAPVAA